MKTFKSTLAVVCLIMITGCNTVQGIGKDIQAAGSAVSATAEVAKGD
jgi:predicted small secreted protein